MDWIEKSVERMTSRLFIDYIMVRNLYSLSRIYKADVKYIYIFNQLSFNAAEVTVFGIPTSLLAICERSDMFPVSMTIVKANKTNCCQCC